MPFGYPRWLPFRVCSNDHAQFTGMPYIFFFKIKNCLNDDLFISCDDRMGKMLHNICISAVAMTRGPLVLEFMWKDNQIIFLSIPIYSIYSIMFRYFAEKVNLSKFTKDHKYFSGFIKRFNQVLSFFFFFFFFFFFEKFG